MKRIIYISSATDEMTETELENILKTSVKKNTAANTTGILLFNGLNFLQVLEGTDEQIDDLYAHIAKDPRHSGVVTVLNESIDEAVFENWGMRLSVKSGSAAGYSYEMGYQKDLTVDLPATLPPHVQRILKSFNTLKG